MEKLLIKPDNRKFIVWIVIILGLVVVASFQNCGTSIESSKHSSVDDDNLGDPGNNNPLDRFSDNESDDDESDDNGVPGEGFGLPVQCTYGTDCWIFNYPDAGEDSIVKDFRCHHMTYNDHKGTDIAVRDVAAIRQGVSVLAAASGEVLRLRDGIQDDFNGTRNFPQGQDCGNGIVISHGDQWETQYCHLKNGSFNVQVGDQVEKGQIIGLMGMSGNTVFPHLHITIRFNGNTLDPFTGEEVFSGCGNTTEQNLWHSSVRFNDVHPIIIATGFSTGPVKMPSIQKNASSPETLSSDSPAMVLWAVIIGVRQGDVFQLEITDPNGQQVFSGDRITLNRNYIRYFRYSGKRLTEDSWPSGTYTGRVRIERTGGNSSDIVVKESTVAVRVPQ